MSSLFSSPPKPKSTPKVAAPVVMPTPDDDAVNNAKRRALLARQAQSSRASTDLFDKADVLGG
jgi:hypothetical protein